VKKKWIKCKRKFEYIRTPIDEPIGIFNGLICDKEGISFNFNLDANKFNFCHLCLKSSTGIKFEITTGKSYCVHCGGILRKMKTEENIKEIEKSMAICFNNLAEFN